MRTIKSIITAVALSSISATVLAHEGHDHSHWSSDALHILFYSSLAAVAAAISFLVVKQLKSTKANSKNKEL
ncbi:hypothetical protein [Paraglaciecola sp. 2405UD69-4]|uniref:hypothetical protein n=1 Tax=Paraglaciecola sp. 2405UD69-4 TaxID=3391836 RepID=UPI0039C90BED